MKNLIASSAMALALVVSANSASAADFEPEDVIRGLVVSGEVETFSGVMFYDGDGADAEADEDYQFVSGVAGRLSLPLGDNLSLQTDVEVEYSSTALSDGRQDDMFAHSFLGGGHLSWRDPNAGLFGGFAAFGGGASDDNGDDDGTRNFSFYAVGAEGQFYVDNFTFYVQGGYLDGASDSALPIIDSDSLRDAFFGRGVVRWFMDPDTRLQGEIAYADGDVDEFQPSGMTIVEWGVRYDTVIRDLPILGDKSVFIGYRGAHFDKDNASGDEAEFTDHTVMVGFTHRFGTQSIQETDRYGATLDLPNFGRWVSAGQILE